MADSQQIAAALKFYDSIKSLDPFGQQNSGERVMPTLAGIYSAIGSAKRNAADFVQNPIESLQQMVGYANDRARTFNQQGDDAAAEFQQTQSLKGPKQMQLAQLLAEGYNPVGMFIGPNAASFNKITAVKAQELEKLNKTPEEIWQQTGTFRGPDKQWRQEISDKGSKITEDVYNQISANKQFKGPMGQALQHEELYNAYPQTAEIPTTMFADITPSGNILKGKSGTFQTPQITVGGPSSMDQRSVALHELQHAIQQREGFASGGSPNAFKPNDVFSTKALEDAAIIDKLMRGANLNQLEAKQRFETLFNKSPESGAFAALDRIGTGKELDAARDAARLADKPMESYKRLAGEAEARATQKRRNLTDEQRKAIFPLESYDVPINELIFRK